MKRTEVLAQRVREVLLNGIWIANTNYQAQLKNIYWEHAVCQVANLNTIAALTFHINYYLAGLIQVFNGGDLAIRDQNSFDIPEIRSEEEWNSLVNDFLTNAELFSQKVEQLPENLLDHPFVDEKYGNYLRNIEGVIEHSYYHLGQISLINKMIGNKG